MSEIEVLTRKVCEIFTENGQRCPHIARKYNQETGKPSCNMHNFICKKRYEEYKDICKLVKRCNRQMTKSEIRKILKFIKQCKTQRMFFTHVCCGGKTDTGHAYQFVMLDEFEEECEYILNSD